MRRGVGKSLSGPSRGPAKAHCARMRLQPKSQSLFVDGARNPEKSVKTLRYCVEKAFAPILSPSPCKKIPKRPTRRPPFWSVGLLFGLIGAVQRVSFRISPSCFCRTQHQWRWVRAGGCCSEGIFRDPEQDSLRGARAP